MVLNNSTTKNQSFQFSKNSKRFHDSIPSSKDAGNYYHMHVDWTELATWLGWVVKIWLQFVMIVGWLLLDEFPQIPMNWIQKVI